MSFSFIPQKNDDRGIAAPALVHIFFVSNRYANHPTATLPRHLIGAHGQTEDFLKQTEDYLGHPADYLEQTEDLLEQTEDYLSQMEDYLEQPADFYGKRKICKGKRKII